MDFFVTGNVLRVPIARTKETSQILERLGMIPSFQRHPFHGYRTPRSVLQDVPTELDGPDEELRFAQLSNQPELGQPVQHHANVPRMVG